MSVTDEKLQWLTEHCQSRLSGEGFRIFESVLTELMMLRADKPAMTDAELEAEAGVIASRGEYGNDMTDEIVALAKKYMG